MIVAAAVAATLGLTLRGGLIGIAGGGGSGEGDGSDPSVVLAGRRLGGGARRERDIGALDRVDQFQTCGKLRRYTPEHLQRKDRR